MASVARDARAHPQSAHRPDSLERLRCRAAQRVELDVGLEPAHAAARAASPGSGRAGPRRLPTQNPVEAHCCGSTGPEQRRGRMNEADASVGRRGLPCGKRFSSNMG